MTDLSFRIKKIYENNLLPFEKVGENWSWTVAVSFITDLSAQWQLQAVLDGSIEGVHMPPRVAQSAPSGPSMKPSRPGRASKVSPLNHKAPVGKTIRLSPINACVVVQRGSSGLPGNAPKRTRQNADGSTDEMVGKRIRVLWPEERQFFSGTVTDFEADKVCHQLYAVLAVARCHVLTSGREVDATCKLCIGCRACKLHPFPSLCVRLISSVPSLVCCRAFTGSTMMTAMRSCLT